MSTTSTVQLENIQKAYYGPCKNSHDCPQNGGVLFMITCVNGKMVQILTCVNQAFNNTHVKMEKMKNFLIKSQNLK